MFRLDSIIKKLTEKYDTQDAGPLTGMANAADYLLSGFIMLFPLMFFREIIYPGITEQDIYLYVFSVVIMIVSAVYGWHEAKKQISVSYTTFTLIILAIINLAVSMVQVIYGDGRVNTTAGYAAGLLIILSVRFLGLRGRRYLKIFIIPLTIIYLFLYYHFFTGSSTVFAIEALTGALWELIPFLLLGSLVLSVLFFTAQGTAWKIVYALIFIAGAGLIIIYGDRVSLCLLVIEAVSTCILFELYPRTSSGHGLWRILSVLGGFVIVALLVYALYCNTGTGEWWFLINRYGQVGFMVFILAVVAFAASVKADGIPLMSGSNGMWLLMAGFGGLISLFYPFTLSSMPIWLIYSSAVLIIPHEYPVYDRGAAMTLMGDSETDSKEDVIPDPENSDDNDLEFVNLDDMEDSRRQKSGKRRSGAVMHHSVLISLSLISLIMLGLIIAIPIKGRGVPVADVQDKEAAEPVYTDLYDDSQSELTDDISDIPDDPKTAVEEDFDTNVVDVGAMTDEDINDLGVDLSGIDLDALLYGESGEDDGTEVLEAGIEDTDAAEEAAAIGSNTQDEDGMDDNSNENADYTVYDPNAKYTKSNDIVTASSGSVRLRREPSLGNEGVVVHTLTSDERVLRTGIGDNGWSRLTYNGQTCYAVTEYLTSTGTYHGDPEELKTVTDETDDNGIDDTANEQNVQNQSADAQTAADNKTTGASKTKSGPVGYTIQWSSDYKTCTIWSAGVKQGTMSVNNAEGAQKVNVYPDYYIGNDKNRRKYLSISVPAGESPASVNADEGFMAALKNMGYSGLYFNKQLMEW